MFPEGLKTTLHIYGTDPYDHSRYSQESYSYNILEREGEMEEYKRHLEKLKKTGEYGYYYIYVCDLHKRTMDLVMYVEKPLKQRMEINLKAKASNKPKRKGILGSSAVYYDPFAGNVNPQLWATASEIQDDLPSASVDTSATIAAIQANYEATIAQYNAQIAASNNSAAATMNLTTAGSNPAAEF